MKPLTIAFTALLVVCFTTTMAQQTKAPYVAAYTSSFKIGNPAYANKILELWKDWDDNQLNRHEAYFADTLTMWGPDGSVTRGKAANLEAAAEQADRLLAELPPIDVLILGMGDDGHTASLFPGSPNLAQALDANGTRRCWPMLAPTVPHQRLTMSRALLATAHYTALSISGSSKLTTLSAALASDDVAAMPIRAFLQPTLEIYWCP